MPRKNHTQNRAFLFSAILLIIPWLPATAQTKDIPARITAAIDEEQLVKLSGNVHPLARAEFDRGGVADAQPMTRMLLLLKRSEDQETALQDYLEKQQDKSSPNYHRWLTPQEFGAQYGPADADIQAVTSWLQAKGFQIDQVAAGKTVIEFSGTAGQVRSAFHTEIHRFLVNGEEHTANSSDPQIPAALAPTVHGIVSLNSFPRKFYSIYRGVARRVAGKTGLEPLFTFPSPTGSGTFYGLGPGDFATIYNSKGLISAKNDGTGQTIAIVGETNLNVQDVTDFRSIFGLPATFSASNVILNGEDPGITSQDEETEADLDVQWSGAAAPGATIDFVVSASTPASAGIDLSALYIIEHNFASAMSESYGGCESGLGSAGNAFYNSLWEQAAAQGITVILSSGDGGSAGCDDFNAEAVATQGLAVSGLASTPFNVSVGGTDFDQVNHWSTYWSASNDPVTGTSALSYIPEIPWSENCAQIGLTGCGASAPNGSVNIVAGSGGPSAKYGKPTWQLGVTGMPNDNHRDQPDVSLFASPGFDGTGYLVCQQDRRFFNDGRCLSNGTISTLNLHVVGGTSASAPAFAGIMALVNQYQAAHGGTGRQGNANYILYALVKKAGASCTSSAAEATGCIFNDITKGNSVLPTGAAGLGTNSVPCKGGTPNCSVTAASQTGVLIDPRSPSTEAWTAAAGYDMATGLGSVNVNNLATLWGTVSTVPTTTTFSLNPTTSITHGTGENVTVNITVKATSGTPTGDVSLIATLPGGTTLGLDKFTLSNSTISSTTKSLPGGTYTVAAHYAGDGTNAPSDSAPVSVTVGKESSQTFIVVPLYDIHTGKLISGNTNSVPYGSPYRIRMYVTNAAGVASPSGPPNQTCEMVNEFTCPTGTVTLTANGIGVDGANGIYALNDAGYTRDINPTLTGGTYPLIAQYSGDSSYQASNSSTDTLTVTPAPTTMVAGNPPGPSQVATPFGFNTILRTQSSGVMPSCNVSIFDGATQLPSPVQCGGFAGGAGFGASLQPIFNINQATAGTHTYNVKFTGDANYAPSNTFPMTIRVFYGTTTTLSADSTNVQYGTSITLAAVVDSTVSQGPAMGQSVTFSFNNIPVTGTVTYTPFTDLSGNMALRASLTTVPQSSGFYTANFAGDTNYFQSGALLDVSVNIPDFSVAANLPISSIVAGNSSAVTITVTPTSNSSSPVNLACPPPSLYGTPPGISCSFSPSTVNLSNGNAAASTLTISTLAPSASTTTSSAPLQLPLPYFPPRLFWPLPVASILTLLILFLLPARLRRSRLALGATIACAISLFLGFAGCGGGSTGGGGGGGGGPAPSSITLSVSSVKVPSSPISGGSVNLSANVTSSKTPGGTVTFSIDGGSQGFSVSSPVAGGVAQFQLTNLSVGVHSITAQYSGDSSTSGSQTKGSLNVAVTGQTGVSVQANTGGLFHTIGVNFNLQ